MPLDWDICRKKVSALNIVETSRILDIGSKNNEKANYVIDKGQLILSDISSKNISFQNIFPFLLSDAAHLPFSDNFFDLVTMFHVLEHIKDSGAVLAEIYRILKKNGTLLMVTPNANRLTKIYSSILKIVNKSPYKYPLNPDHFFEYNASDIKDIMNNSEFENYKIEPVFMRLSSFLRIRKYCDQWIVTAQK